MCEILGSKGETIQGIRDMFRKIEGDAMRASFLP